MSRLNSTATESGRPQTRRRRRRQWRGDGENFFCDDVSDDDFFTSGDLVRQSLQNSLQGQKEKEEKEKRPRLRGGRRRRMGMHDESEGKFIAERGSSLVVKE
jgi:hypothetical protein